MGLGTDRATGIVKSRLITLLLIQHHSLTGLPASVQWATASEKRGLASVDPLIFYRRQDLASLMALKMLACMGAQNSTLSCFSLLPKPQEII